MINKGNCYVTSITVVDAVAAIHVAGSRWRDSVELLLNYREFNANTDESCTFEQRVI